MQKKPAMFASNPLNDVIVYVSSRTPGAAAVQNLRLTLSQQAPSSTNSHQNSKTREIRSPRALLAAETTEADWRSQERGRERKGAGDENRRGGRVSERKGQTPQQQAWETVKVSRELENSHHTAE